MMNLYTPTEIEIFQQDLPYLIEITAWVNTFLARPHPHLGRPGVVCPYVSHALKSNNIQMLVIRTQNLDLAQIEDIVQNYRSVFLEAAAKEKEIAMYKAVVLIFPDVDIEAATQIIDPIQQKLKPFFVESGLMIGEFHGRTENPGLHNPNFRPLRSPTPLLAIRFMNELDLPFLQSPDNPHLRISYLESYLKYFHNQIQDETKLKKIYETLALAKAEVQSESLEVV
jgi:hypothetical protein